MKRLTISVFMPLLAGLLNPRHSDGWMSDDQETNYSVQVHPPSDSKNSGNEGGKGQITTTRTPNGSGVQSSFQDQSTDQKNSMVVNKGQLGSIASNTEETTRMKEVVVSTL